MTEEESVRKSPPRAHWQPSGWPLLTKISVVLLLPVLVALVLAGTRVQAELARAGGLSAVRDQMPVLSGITELSGLLDDEIGSGGPAQDAAVVTKAAAVRHAADFARLAPDATRTLDTELGKVIDVTNADGSPVAKATAYHGIVLALSEVVPSVVAQAGSRDLDKAANIAASLLQLRAILAVERAPGQAADVTRALAAEESVLGAQIQRALPAGAEAARFSAATAAGVGDPAARNRVLGDLLAGHVAALSDSVGQQTNTARADALRDSALVLGSLLGALTVALLVARSLLAPVRRLHTAALDVARRRLPETIERIREGEDVRWQELEPIPVDSEEEIGQLARAFDDLHQQAVRLAIGEQAELRLQVSEMFMTLSRRSQSLVELQLSVIEDLEADEQDPQRLSELFEVDHIATRLRRNGENLQVLAGGRPARRDHGPVATVELLRAATSEVKDYQRVTLGNAPHGSIHAQAAADVVHILAELLENAIRFSPPDEQVLLTADRGADGGVLIEVVDTGLGMSAEDLAAANEHPAAGDLVSPETTRRMGLFVVGRLAAPHGVTVRLRPTTTRAAKAGITASVHVPGELVQVDLPPRHRPSPTARNGAPYRIPQQLPGGAEPEWPTEEEPAAQETVKTPIFDQMLSHWFTEPLGTNGNSWVTPADEARRAAESAIASAGGVELTAAGLPTRQPGAQLAPGTATPRQARPGDGGFADHGFRDPVAVRNNLSRHYSGMRAARHRVAKEES
jgi:signal transduction histidine kinase